MYVHLTITIPSKQVPLTNETFSPDYDPYPLLNKASLPL